MKTMLQIRRHHFSIPIKTTTLNTTIRQKNKIKRNAVVHVDAFANAYATKFPFWNQN